MTTRDQAADVNAAVVTDRPVLIDAWRDVCGRVGVPFTGSASSSDDPSSSRWAPQTVVLADVASVAEPWLRVLSAAGGSRVLALCTLTFSPAVGALLRGGCRWVVTVADPSEVLARALRAALADEPFASSSGLSLVFAAHQASPPPSPGATSIGAQALTSREREVLASMVEGLTIKATARALGVAVKTIEGHRRSIFTKLAVSSQADAITRVARDPQLLGGVRSLRSLRR